jgi:hypothetical protein
MQWDWYQATVPEEAETLAEALREAFAPGGSVELGRGRHNYRESHTVLQACGERVGVVLAGGANGDPNVTVSGVQADAFAEWLRREWPEHRVTRFDVAEDLRKSSCDDLYGELEPIVREVGRCWRLRPIRIVPDYPQDGRTCYLGARASSIRARLYDKSAEMIAKASAAERIDIPSGIVRLELQVRPKGREWKSHASRIPLAEVWGYAPWAADLAAQVLALDVERIKMRQKRERDDSRAYSAMIAQYRNVLWQMRKDLGSWEALGCDIGQHLHRSGAHGTEHAGRDRSLLMKKTHAR